MDSLTKRKLSAEELEQLVAHAFPDAAIAQAEELTDGWFNAVYDIELEDGRGVVLKVAPPPGTRTLTYEHGMMRSELEFLARARDGGVAVPEVLFADASGELVESEWFAMRKLRGRTIADLQKDASPDELAAIRRALGVQVARLHGVIGGCFGYLDATSRTRQPTWRGSFLTMLDDVLGDANELGVELPRPTSELAALFAAHGDALDAVAEPRLVHFDLWDNNVFVVGRDGAFEIEGIIDGERCFYGDPLAEFVGIAVAGDPDDQPALVAGYEAEAGAGLARDDAARRRLALYKIYLAIIMFTEGPTRGFAGAEHEPYLEWASGFFHTELELLDRSLVTTIAPSAPARHHERIHP